MDRHDLNMREPDGFGASGAGVAIDLPNTQGPTQRLLLLPGQRYHIVTVASAQHGALLAQLPAPPESAVVTAKGGLISNLRIMENLTLPACYHLRIEADELEPKLLALLHATGLDDKSIGLLVAKLPAQATHFEKCLVSFVRAALLQPRVLVYDALWDEMTKHERDDIAHFDEVFRTFCPTASALFLHGEHQAGPRGDFDQVLHCGVEA